MGNRTGRRGRFSHKGRRNLLDVVLPDGPIVPEAKRPMLLQIHGGGWVYGDKERQGQPLMAELASRGWVCFAINYRLCPKATFEDLVVDVKRAIGFIREHALEYGGDPGFLAPHGGPLRMAQAIEPCGVRAVMTAFIAETIPST